MIRLCTRSSACRICEYTRKHEIQFLEQPAKDSGPGWGRSSRHAMGSMPTDRPKVATLSTDSRRDRGMGVTRETGDTVMAEARCDLRISCAINEQPCHCTPTAAYPTANAPSQDLLCNQRASHTVLLLLLLVLWPMHSEYVSSHVKWVRLLQRGILHDFGVPRSHWLSVQRAASGELL
jgi:hypothetical protein